MAMVSHTDYSGLAAQEFGTVSHDEDLFMALIRSTQKVAAAFGRSALRVQIVTAEDPEHPIDFPVNVPCLERRALGNARNGTDDPFVLTPFQEAILEALEGVALRTRALGAAVGDVSRLYKPGGLQELRAHGLVDHHHRLGFFRPDTPPEQLRKEG
jgi:hypothetical protein